YRTAAQVLHERGHGRRMTETRAVIDVVRAETDTNELLEEVRLLFAALRRAEACKCAAAMLVANATQPVGCTVERLVPGRLTYRGELSCRFYERVRILWHVVAEDVWCVQVLRAVHLVETETPFHAQAAPVGRTVATIYAYDPIVADIVCSLAADTQ